MNIAINGFGRIGRTYYRAAMGADTDQHGLEHESTLNIVAINDPGDVKNLEYLLKYDSIYGIYDKKPSAKFFGEKDPANLPWKELGVDLVIESSGFFTEKIEAQKHLDAGAKKVIITAPSETADITIIPGVNDKAYNSEEHHIISMGSCTTNCIVPLVAVLDNNFKIVKGSFVTVHSYTATQGLVDKTDKKDFRRGRAAGENIVPTTTGASKAIYQIFPHLSGKIDSLSMRIPTPAVSLVEFVCEVEKDVSKENVLEAFEQAEKEMNGALELVREPLVSIDFRGNPHGSILDTELTTVTENKLIRLVAWYDNEMGYSNRLVELSHKIMI